MQNSLCRSPDVWPMKSMRIWVERLIVNGGELYVLGGGGLVVKPDDKKSLGRLRCRL
jgi:hypothetical protein